MAIPVLVGISQCLLGDNVRYDGGHKRDSVLIEALGRYVEWVPVCPEVEIGLGTPREPMRLVGDLHAPRLITTNTGVDHTNAMTRFAQQRVRELEALNLSDRKSTRLNSSHRTISYAVFCLKKKNTQPSSHTRPRRPLCDSRPTTRNPRPLPHPHAPRRARAIRTPRSRHLTIEYTHSLTRPT